MIPIIFSTARQMCVVTFEITILEGNNDKKKVMKLIFLTFHPLHHVLSYHRQHISPRLNIRISTNDHRALIHRHTLRRRAHRITFADLLTPHRVVETLERE